ncbi:hypothetical protein GWI33_016389 [Rhynchophorus ferrugineus]|uniref:Uncharacterized protein n=1 Tax=Rhynchophorus ferrugineus TaxID=354439 RepID=A0A834I1P0_RHYFE|nr:hypothetical protein GWI33_016389 [Rhynchophorus ferrugineus]
MVRSLERARSTVPGGLFNFFASVSVRGENDLAGRRVGRRSELTQFLALCRSNYVSAPGMPSMGLANKNWTRASDRFLSGFRGDTPRSKIVQQTPAEIVSRARSLYEHVTMGSEEEGGRHVEKCERSFNRHYTGSPFHIFPVGVGLNNANTKMGLFIVVRIKMAAKQMADGLV